MTKSPEQIRSEALSAASDAERDARAFNKLLVSPDPQITKQDRTIYMGLVWHFIAEYQRKMTLLKGYAAAARDVGSLRADLIKEQQQLLKMGPDGADLLRQFNLRLAAPIDDSTS